LSGQGIHAGANISYENLIVKFAVNFFEARKSPFWGARGAKGKKKKKLEKKQKASRVGLCFEDGEERYPSFDSLKADNSRPRGGGGARRGGEQGGATFVCRFAQGGRC